MNSLTDNQTDKLTTCYNRRQVVQALFALPLLAALPYANAQAQQKRVALVVGNRAYQNANSLTNPVNDATDMAKTLLACGFAQENILLRTDRTDAQLTADIKAFKAKLDANTVALFYFSGHGMQIEGKNYLLPVDFQDGSVLEMKKQALDAEGLLKEIPCALRILILDACRDNPFTPDKGIGGDNKGLNFMRVTGNTLIAFATALGETASDNPGEHNGLYTRYLLQEIVRPGLSLTEVFNNVSKKVFDASQTKDKPQDPWVNFNRVPSFVFVPGKKPEPGPEPEPIPPLPRLFNPTTATVLFTLKGHSGIVYSAVFSPDGKRIVTGSEDHLAKEWDATTGKEILTLEGHYDAIHSAVFSPDGKRILTGCSDNTAKLWDATPGKELFTLNVYGGAVYSVAFSPDGKYIVTGGNDNTAKVWDATTGKAILTLKGHRDSVRSAMFSPDGKHIVTGSEDTTAKIWDASSGESLLTLTGHNNYVTSVAFSPSSRHILTGSLDDTAKLWGATTGQEILTLKGHGNSVNSVAFSPDGRHIVTGSADKTAKVWELQ